MTLCLALEVILHMYAGDSSGFHVISKIHMIGQQSAALDDAVTMLVIIRLYVCRCFLLGLDPAYWVEL